MSRSKLTVPPGGRAFHAYVRAYAHAVVPVVLTSEDLERVAENLGRPVAELTPEDLREAVGAAAYDRTPTLGVCCSGGHYASDPSLELSDVWEASDDDDASVPLGDVLRELGPDEIEVSDRA